MGTKVTKVATYCKQGSATSELELTSPQVFP
jgi:hypothetical protein